MSQYISSFFIDPVVRQARRFSRNSIGGSDSPRDVLATAPLAPQENQQDLPLNTRAELLSPSAIDDLDSRSLQEWREEQGIDLPLGLIDINRQERESPVGQSSSNDVDNTPDTRSTSDSLRSTTSSTNNPAHSVLAQGSAHSSIMAGPGHEDSQASIVEGQTLPEDDGMSIMRNRILAIQSRDSSNEMKARLIHDVMVESHSALRKNLPNHRNRRARSRSSMQSSERPVTPSSTRSMGSTRQTMSPSASSSPRTDDSVDPFQLTAEDLKPTYYVPPGPASKQEEGEGGLSESEEEPRELGCAHYKRNVKLQCSICDQWYTCRFCHDEEEDHLLKRRETKNMLCMLCGSAQRASEACAVCGVRGAWYYCKVCKLWDDDSEKNIYHCNDCGICRRGQGLGKDFFHCKVCSVCMSISIRDTHRCIERATDCDCPICGDYMFTSPQTVVFMPCGHSIHRKCYDEHIKNSYRCPICSRTMINMEWQFSRMDRDIEAQPMPPEFKDTKARISCNDCSAKTSVKYHWVGLKCLCCDSYNTVQLSLLSTPASPPDPPSPSSSASRGRPRHPQTPHRTGVSAPPASSSGLTATHDPAMDDLFPSNPSSQDPGTGAGRSASATPLTWYPFSRSPSVSEVDQSDSASEEELGFWGGESPQSTRLSSRRAGSNAPPPPETEGTGEEEWVDDDDDDDDDDSNDDDEGDQEDSSEAEEEKTPEEEEEEDSMEIFGHP